MLFLPIVELELSHQQFFVELSSNMAFSKTPANQYLGAYKIPYLQLQLKHRGESGAYLTKRQRSDFRQKKHRLATCHCDQIFLY